MRTKINIAIAEPSLIIKNGLTLALKKIASLDIEIAIISDIRNLSQNLSILDPDILIINPSYLGISSLQQIKNQTDYSNLKVIALKCSMLDSDSLKSFDQIIELYDTQEQIQEKVLSIMESKEQKNKSSQLSEREKDIVICVVKGLSNKEIAKQLYISTHTVMAHRRNIANKLQIHSTAGLTIFAIVNKLVNLNELSS